MSNRVIWQFGMFKKLLKLIGTKPGEEKVVTLLLGHGFFMGIFIATYQLSAETLFTGIPEFENRLDEAFLIQGFLGVISTFLFAYFQNRIRFSTLILVEYINIFLYLVGILVLFNVYYHVNLVYALFVMLGPLTALVLLSFWGIFGRLFDLRQSKRIIGGIDTGQLTGTILAFILISLLSKFKVIENSINLIFISAVSVLGAIIFMLEIIKSFDLDVVKKKNKQEVAETRFSKILKDRFVILLSVFVVVSVIVYKFVDYSFLQVTPMQYPDEQIRLTFLSVFNGGIMILSFLIQTFINDRIIMNYGLKVSLLVLPSILLVFTIAAIVTGSMFGYTQGAEGHFIYFFLCISLSKLFATSVRDALENPAFKLFFLSIDFKIRFDIQAKVEGVVNQVGNIMAGVILVILGFSYFTYIELIHYSFLLIFILMGMVYVIYKLYNQYRFSLRQKLSSHKESMGNAKFDYNVISDVLQNAVEDPDPYQAIVSLKLLELLEPVLFEKRLVEALQHRDPLVREYVLKKIEKNKSIQVTHDLSNLVANESAEGLKELALKIVKQMESSDNLNLSQFQFFILVRSNNLVDREFAARFLQFYDKPDFQHFLIELLNDIEPKVRGAAMLTACKLGNKEFWPILIDNLSIHRYSSAAFSSLISLGEDVLDNLDNAFYKTDQKVNTLVQIVKIYGRIGGEKAMQLLWNKIDYPNRHVVSNCLSSLLSCNFQAKDNQIVIIKNYINRYIGYIVWNMAAINEIPDGKNWELLKSSIIAENEDNYDHVYLLMSLIYDRQSIQLVRENIKSGTNDAVTFAIELLDVFVAEDIKSVLVPVLDDISYEEVSRRLNEQYPREAFRPKELLLQIINRDYNITNVWTKACALYNFGLLDEVEVEDDIVANLFNQDNLIREMAAWVIYQIAPESYDPLTNRIAEKKKKNLDEVIIPVHDNGFSIKTTKFHKVLFLSKIDFFANLPAIILTRIALKMQEIKVRTGAEIHDYSKGDQSLIYCLVKGQAILIDDESKEQLIESSIIGDLLIFENKIDNTRVIAKEDCILYKIEREILFDLIPVKFHTFKKLLPGIEKYVKEKLEYDKVTVEDII